MRSCKGESQAREAHAAANLPVVRRMTATLIKWEPACKGGLNVPDVVGTGQGLPSTFWGLG